MRILHVLEAPVGGAATHVRDLSRGLIARGHHVEAIVSPRGWAADALREVGVQVALVDFRPEMTATGADLRAVGSLARLLARRRWDLVHTHGHKPGALARPLARARGLCVVHSPHGFAYPTQRLRPRRGVEARRALTWGIERLLAPLAHAIVCVSEAERVQAVSDRIARPDRFEVVRNGIAIASPVAPDPRLVAFRGDIPLVGFQARLDPLKAPLVLVEALARLRARGVEFRGALVGDGPLADVVRARVADTGLTDEVLVLPFNGAPEPVLASVDIYVLPSLFEAFGIGALEAMAARIPVVASNVGGLSEIVVEGETGLLVPPADPGALVGAIERLLADPGLRGRMGEAGRARCLESFTLERMVTETELVYERALQRARGTDRRAPPARATV